VRERLGDPKLSSKYGLNSACTLPGAFIFAFLVLQAVKNKIIIRGVARKKRK
jgi:hypothetical protein